MKHIYYFDKFLNDHVNLNQTRIETLDGRVESITSLLESKLEGFRKYSKQGSYSHRTIIKPVKDNDEFDADILIFIRDDNFSPYKYQEDYVERIFDVFKNNRNYKDIVKLNSRCCTLDYSGEVHIDIVPCIEYGNDKYICNRKEKKYEKTDGDGYKEWLNKRNRIIGKNSFIKVTRLLKYLRDHKSNFTVKSILLTTILGTKVKDYEENPDEFKDLVETLKTLSNKVNDWLQERPTMPTIKNPVLDEENFNRNWDEKQYQNFRDKFETYTKYINEAYEETNHNESVKKWRKLFGDDFGELQGSNSSGKVATGAGAVIGTTSPRVPAQKPYSSTNQTEIPASVNHKVSSIEMQNINQFFPNLYHENEVIKGEMNFRGMYQRTDYGKDDEWEIVPCSSEDECIEDVYEIEIHIDNKKSGYPKVFEVGGRIRNLAHKRNKPIVDLHIYPQDGSCCLGIFPKNPNETLSGFVKNKVYPYFMWQAYFEKFNKIPPVGEYSHGKQGLQEYLSSKFNKK